MIDFKHFTLMNKSFVLQYYIILIMICSILNVINSQSCYFSNRLDKPSEAKHVCSYNKDDKPSICTSNKFTLETFGRKGYCMVGNLKTNAWKSSYKGAKVIYMDEAIVHKYPSQELYMHINDIGFYLAITFQNDLTIKQMKNLFNHMTLNFIKDELKIKSEERIKSVINMIGDIAGELGPKGKIIQFIIKFGVLLHELSPDPKEDDYLKFIAVYEPISRMILMCNSEIDVEVAACIKSRNDQPIIIGIKTFKFSNCERRTVNSDNYLRIFQGPLKILTTNGGGVFSDSPLYNLCTNDLPNDRDYFTYHYIQVLTHQEICCELWERNTLRSDSYREKQCKPLSRVMRFDLNRVGFDIEIQ